MANELWIDELKMYAEKAQMKEDPSVLVDPDDLLKLIELATAAPPPDALAQCQAREDELREEVQELEDDNWTLRHDVEALELERDELESQVQRLENEVERNLRA